MRQYCLDSHTCLKCSGMHLATKCHEKYQSNRPVMSQPSSDKPAPHFFLWLMEKSHTTNYQLTGTSPINLCDMDFYLFLYSKTLEASELRDGFKYGF